MKIVKPFIVVEQPIDGMEILKHIEKTGRTCYKSEERITGESAIAFVRDIIKRGHESVLEHFSISVRVICDRGVSHEIVRHRIASYSQESTRYCNYSKDQHGNELTFIDPCFWPEGHLLRLEWMTQMMAAEQSYLALIAAGASPQEARSVLPNSLKTELVMTMNLREWRHFFLLRTAPAAHPQMREVANMIHQELKSKIALVFDM